MRLDLLLPFEKYHIPAKRIAEPLSSLAQEINSLVSSGVYRLYPSKCLCGNNQDFELLASVDKNGILAPLSVCRKCGMIMTNPHYSEVFYSDLKKHKRYLSLFFGYEDIKDYVLAKFNHFEGTDIYNFVGHVTIIDQQTKILEIGAGAGWNLLPFVQAGAKVKGFESDKQLVDIGRQLGMNVEHMALTDLPDKADYDVVILSGLLNRVFSPIKLLHRIVNLVRESGIIYVDVPVLDIKKLDYRVDRFYYFTTDTLRYFMAEAGLKPLEIRSINGKVVGVFRREDYPNSKYLLTRNKKLTYKEIKYLRRREMLRFSKKIKRSKNVQIFSLLEKIN